MAHIQVADDDCVIAAIKLAGRISHNVELCRGLPGASIKTLIAAVARLANESDSKSVRTVVLWYICMQQFTTAQAAKVVPAMLQAISEATFADTSSSAVQAEGIKALNKLLVCCSLCANLALFCHGWGETVRMHCSQREAEHFGRAARGGA